MIKFHRKHSFSFRFLVFASLPCYTVAIYFFGGVFVEFNVNHPILFLLAGLLAAFVSKNWKIALAPIALMLVLFIFVPALNAGTVGIMVPVSVLFTIAVSRILCKKGVLWQQRAHPPGDRRQGCGILHPADEAVLSFFQR